MSFCEDWLFELKNRRVQLVKYCDSDKVDVEVLFSMKIKLFVTCEYE